MQSLFLALTSIQAVLIGTSYALTIAYLQVVAARYSPGIAELARKRTLVWVLLVGMVIVLAFLAAGAVVSSTWSPAPSLPPVLFLASLSRHSQARVVASVAAGGVVLSVGGALLIIRIVAGYADALRTTGRLAHTAVPNRLETRVSAQSRSALRCIIEIMQAALRDGDRTIHREAAASVAQRLHRHVASSSDPVRLSAYTEWVVSGLFAQATRLAEARGPWLFAQDVVAEAVNVIVKLPGHNLTPLVSLLDYAQAAVVRALDSGEDTSAAEELRVLWDAFEAWWCQAAHPAASDAVRRLLEPIGRLGMQAAATAIPLTTESDISTVKPWRGRYSPTVRLWCERAAQFVTHDQHQRLDRLQCILPFITPVVDELARRSTSPDVDQLLLDGGGLVVGLCTAGTGILTRPTDVRAQASALLIRATPRLRGQDNPLAESLAQLGILLLDGRPESSGEYVRLLDALKHLNIRVVLRILEDGSHIHLPPAQVRQIQRGLNAR